MKHSDLQTVPPIIREYLVYLQTIKGKSEKTVDEYYRDLRTFFRFIIMQRDALPSPVDFENISISRVDLELVKSVSLLDAYEFLTYCNSERGNNAKTRARKCCSLRGYFKYLTIKVNKLDVDPMEQLDAPKPKKSLPKYLSLEQSVALLNSVDGSHRERDYCILTIFLNCGLRLSELCGLNLPDIRDNTVRVVGKGNKERIVYLNSACISSIESYLPVRARDIAVVRDKNALFLSRLGKRISNKTVQHIVYEFLDKSGLGGQGLSAHKLRHTAATLMYQYGNVDIRVLKDVLGHENLGTTEIYTHLSEKQLEEASQANPLASIKAKKTPAATLKKEEQEND